MKPHFKSALILLALVSLVGCDQVSKSFARERLPSSGPEAYLGGVVRLQFVQNTGSFLGVGADLPETVRFLAHCGTSAAVVAGLILLILQAGRLKSFGLAGCTLLLSGASGNLVDRLTNQGKMVDFLMIDVGWARTGVFNLADVLILSGVALVLFSRRSLRSGPP